MAQKIPTEDGGSRITIIINGSGLSNGDCDWMDAIVMLPEQLFYDIGTLLRMG